MIESKNIYLKPVTEEDRDYFISIYSNDYLLRGVTNPLSLNFCSELFDEALLKKNGKGQKKLIYIIINKKTKENMGCIGLTWGQDSDTCVELGVIITQRYHKKNIAENASLLLMKHAFTHLKILNLFALTNAKNIAVNRVIKKVGFIKSEEYFDTESDQMRFKWNITPETLNPDF